jgi:hypothetical protein
MNNTFKSHNNHTFNNSIIDLITEKDVSAGDHLSFNIDMQTLPSLFTLG